MINKNIISIENYIYIFGIRFLKNGFQDAKQLLLEGGFMIVPSAPSLTYIKSDSYYYECLKGSDFAIPDSSLMVLILRYLYHVRIQKLSGLKFLKLFLFDIVTKEKSRLFLIEPSESEHVANQTYLQNIGVNYNVDNYYVAPIYQDQVIEDYTLLSQLEKNKPEIILINLGGGIQEKLGYFLKQHLSYKTVIICTGAAIAFLSGKQTNIPDWADKLYLGWFVRCINNPKRFIPRYLGSIKLVFMLFGCNVEVKE